MFLVGKLRAAADRWRDESYPGISGITQRLFQFWFDEDHPLPDGTPWRYWWAQREAIETLVYLTEGRNFADFASLCF
jgi:type III restriction enzyme